MDGQELYYINITIQTWQAVSGLAVLLIVIGLAWGAMRSDIKNVKSGLFSLRSSFDDLVRGMALTGVGPEGRTESPMMPSELGQKLLNESGVQRVISGDSFKISFFEEIDEIKPKSGYEVERTVFSALLRTKSDEQWKAVKEYIFNNPIVDSRPLTMERLLMIASWELRDEYLKIHPTE